MRRLVLPMFAAMAVLTVVAAPARAGDGTGGAQLAPIPLVAGGVSVRSATSAVTGLGTSLTPPSVGRDGLAMSMPFSPYLTFGSMVAWQRAGLDPTRAGPGATQPGGFQLGGFAAIAVDRYRLDMSVRGVGGRGAEIGAGLAGDVPLTGSTYSVRLGAGWSDSAATSISVNPQGGALFDLDREAGPDVNLAFTAAHPITSSLSINGLAEARHLMGDPSTRMLRDDNRYMVGAGLGWKF